MSSPVLYVLGVSQEAWTKRFGVVPFEHPCQGCGATRRTSIPFARGTIRGLVAPACPCGEAFAPYAIVRDPRVGDLLSGSMRLDE